MDVCWDSENVKLLERRVARHKHFFQNSSTQLPHALANSHSTAPVACVHGRLHAWGFRSRFGVFCEGKKSGFSVFRDVSAPARRGRELRISGFWDGVSKRSVPDFRENGRKYDARVLELRSLGSSRAELSIEI